MQYAHMPRDSTIDSNGSTPFQAHQSLGQALGNHLATAQPYNPRNDAYRALSTSPPSNPASHSPLAFAVSPAAKRKHPDPSLASHVLKRRRDTDDADAFDLDPAGQGAKHWTDEEKSRLFVWLMGPAHDDHWNSLRATKNSSLRECAVEVFGGKKTYQALKGCYERNFNLFKQIYAFETFHDHAAGPSNIIAGLSEADRLREYERRLQSARKNGCDMGNITARSIDHWHRMGWYELFYRRWHGDPATTRPVQPRNASSGGPMAPNGTDDNENEDESGIEFSIEPMPSGAPSYPGPSHIRMASGSTHQGGYINPQNLRDPPTPLPVLPSNGNSAAHTVGASTSSNSNSVTLGLSSGSGSAQVGADTTVVNLAVTQSMAQTYLQLLQVQTQTGKMKLEYLRRKEEREEKESNQRRELERLKAEREAAEFEHHRHSLAVKAKADRAIELLNNAGVDGSIKQAAGDYLKKLFE